MSPVGPDRREEALRAANKSPRRLGRARGGARFRLGGREWLRVLPAALVLFLLLRTFLVEAYRIPSRSMERTLLVGDFLLVNKALYGADLPFTNRRMPGVRALRRDDVVVFAWPVDPSKNFVKRLVGLPGDTLLMRGGLLQRNGQSVAEPWVYRSGAPADSLRDDWGPLVVPPRHFFALGDHRDHSLDSRYWGTVPDSLLIGAPWVVYFSYTPDSTAAAPWLTRIRWSRIGAAIR
jgi:signal peptidase I